MDNKGGWWVGKSKSIILCLGIIKEKKQNFKYFKAQIMNYNCNMKGLKENDGGKINMYEYL